MNKLGIDLGGTKIEAMVLDPNGKVLHNQRIATPQGSYSGTLNAINDLIQQADQQFSRFECVGIGTPGAISPSSGLMRNANSTCLNNHPLLEDLTQCLQRKVHLANDANCFALSEATDGAAQDAAIVFGVIIGTGTGAGIVINQQILTGANAISGEWGHNPLPYPNEFEFIGHECYCGRQGCIETWLSGPALEKHYYQASQQHLSTEDIVSAALQGDKGCEHALQNYEHRLAKSLAHIINILDPHKIVLGGGLSNIDRLYQNVPQLWKPFIFSDTVNTQLVKPQYGDASGVRGAAWLC